MPGEKYLRRYRLLELLLLPVVVVALIAVTSGCGTAGHPAKVEPAEATPSGSGYLSHATDPRMSQVLPIPPYAGTPRYEADRQVFLQTRKLKGSARWLLAKRDATWKVGDMMDNFNCAVGVRFNPSNAPGLAALLRRVSAATDRITTAAKDIDKRKRPFLIDPGAVCTAKPESFDYPSGHASWGWAVGLILTELVPDRATDILLRTRAYADSRVVCGAHNLSAIEAGAMNGASIVATLHGSERFRRDMEVARDELRKLAKTGMPVGRNCVAQKNLISKTPY